MIPCPPKEIDQTKGMSRYHRGVSAKGIEEENNIYKILLAICALQLMCNYIRRLGKKEC